MIQVEEQPFKPSVRTIQDIERDDIVRRTLEEAERRLLGTTTNTLYRQAWKVAIRILRGMRPKL
jgi:hypothetical protein